MHTINRRNCTKPSFHLHVNKYAENAFTHIQLASSQVFNCTLNCKIICFLTIEVMAFCCVSFKCFSSAELMHKKTTKWCHFYISLYSDLRAAAHHIKSTKTLLANSLQSILYSRVLIKLYQDPLFNHFFIYNQILSDAFIFVFIFICFPLH